MPSIKPLKNIKTTLEVAPDKSISHRALIFSSLCSKKVKIYSCLQSNDTLATLNCLKKMGVNFKQKKNFLLVEGKGIYFSCPRKVRLFADESGTTLRILLGLLVGQKSNFSFQAASSLRKRPMGRVVYPLLKMQAQIKGIQRKNKTGCLEVYPPLLIEPSFGKLIGKTHQLQIASAQVKSAILLAGLYARGKTSVSEPYKSRDHTERMLKIFGADIKINKNTVSVNPVKTLKPPRAIFIPSDFSSASFFLVLGLILKESCLTLKKVNINPTRSGLLDVLKKMGADISFKNKKDAIEPYADIIAKSSQLKAVKVDPGQIPAMIDEIPILCVAAAFAQGKTEIRGVKELKVKETDRLNSMVTNLAKSGVKIKKSKYKQDDWKIIIEGNKNYHGNHFLSYGDHRTAMSMIIFALAACGSSSIDNTRCINKSFPNFLALIKSFEKK